MQVMTNHHTVTTINRQVSKKLYKSRIPVFSQCFVNLFFVVFVEEFFVLYYSCNILYPPSFIFALLWIHLCDVAVDNGKKHPKHSLQPTLCDHPVLTKTRLPVQANIRFAILLKFKAFYSWDFFFVRIPFPSHSAISH